MDSEKIDYAKIYPELFQFFGCNFHEDSDLNYGSNINVCIRNYVHDTGDKYIMQVITEMQYLRNQFYSDAQLNLMLDSLGVCYWPGMHEYKLSTNEWLDKVYVLLNDEFQKKLNN